MTHPFSLQPHLDQLHAKPSHALAFCPRTLKEFTEWQHALRVKLKQMLGIDRNLSFDYLLRGRTLLGERCWDGMCAINFLQTRADIQLDTLGCTGHSGGGTTALWLTALESRITASVVAGYFSSFNDSILGMPHCECNYVPHILQWAEMGDIAALIAPRPLCLLNGELDPLFPIRAAREQFETVKRAFSLHQASGSCSLSVHSGEHVYHHALAREWFEKFLSVRTGTIRQPQH